MKESVSQRQLHEVVQKRHKEFKFFLTWAYKGIYRSGIKISAKHLHKIGITFWHWA